MVIMAPVQFDSGHRKHYAHCGAPTGLSVKGLGVTPLSLVDTSFRKSCCLHLQSRRNEVKIRVSGKRYITRSLDVGCCCLGPTLVPQRVRDAPV
jgi:hypothetical protein